MSSAMNELNSRTVVITGAGRGLGAAFALVLAASGCDLVLCGRRLSDLETIGKLIVERGGNIPQCVALDLANPESVREAARAIAARKLKIDILINNGAMWLEAREAPFEDAEVLGVINAAITGTFLFTQSLHQLLFASDAPDVVIIGSTSGLPNAILQNESVPFYAAKRGQVALADGFRQSFAGTKIRSILVNPPDLDDVQPDQQEWVEATQRHKGQPATNRDVVEAVVFAITRPRHISMTIDMSTDDVSSLP
jgi:NADP-dependent 3-hydroxy acid dehydrogenase YdfG